MENDKKDFAHGRNMPRTADGTPRGEQGNHVRPLRTGVVFVAVGVKGFAQSDPASEAKTGRFSVHVSVLSKRGEHESSIITVRK